LQFGNSGTISGTEPVSCCIFCSSVIAAISSLARLLATASFAVSVLAAVCSARIDELIQAFAGAGSSPPPPQAPMIKAVPTAMVKMVFRVQSCACRIVVSLG
jgi:hypothetical protein